MIRNGERARAKDVKTIQPSKGLEEKLNKITLSMDKEWRGFFVKKRG